MSTGKWIYPPGKKAITQALFALMEEKPYEQITVSDIVRKAGISRATYYRNFYRKEDIIRGYLAFLKKEMFHAFENTPVVTEDLSVYLSPDLFERLMVFVFSTCHKEQKKLLLIINNGLGGMILEEMTLYSESIIETGDTDDLYRAFFLQGAAYNMMIQWLKLGAKESPEAIAHRFVTYLTSGIVS